MKTILKSETKCHNPYTYLQMSPGGKRGRCETVQKAERLLSLLSDLVTETSRGANREYSRMIFPTVVIALLYTISLTSPLFFNGTRAFTCRID